MIQWRLVQKREGAPLVCLFLVGSHLDEELRDALPDAAIAATAENHPQARIEHVETARQLTGAGDQAALVGYSAGCQAVRSIILGGLRPMAVMAIDGTHGSLPPQSWQVQVWRDCIERARREEMLFVATCLQQSYVEALPPPQRFASTRHILELALDEELPPGTELHGASLHIYSYPSKAIDADAHRHQQTTVLPLLVSKHLAPLIKSATHDTIPAPPPPMTPFNFRLDFGLAVLEVAKADLNLGIREIGKNAGPEIEKLYLNPLGLPKGSAYCAAGWTSWVRRAEEITGLVSPVKGGPGAKAIMAQFQVAGLWTPAEKLTRDDLRPGVTAIWHRGQPGAWTGHIALVHSVLDSTFWTIECNADQGRMTDAVSMKEHRINEPDLLGIGCFSNGVHDVA